MSSNKLKLFFLAQALFVTFLWSAAKIILKLSLVEVSPFVLMAAIQLVSFLSIWIFYRAKKTKLDVKIIQKNLNALILLGIVGAVAAPIFSAIGLQSVTGTTAGLFASLNIILVIALGYIILFEKPTGWQLMGTLVAILGAYIFLSKGNLGGSVFGLIMIGLGEVAYALNTILTRLIMRGPGDENVIVNLIQNGIGAAVLLPLGLLTGGSFAGLLNWQIAVSVVVVGLIYGLAGMLWASVLDKLEAMEASIMQNTMLIQIALLSVIFLKEQITLNNVLGGAVVLGGAYMVEKSAAVKPKKYAKA